jgi:hypothetical protein
MTDTIKIGKTQFLREKFISTVALAVSYPDIVEKLGMNKTVTTHMKNVKIACEQEKIDTSHLKVWKSETYVPPTKQYKLSSDNQKYFDAFENNEAVKEQSKAAYRSGTGLFLEHINEVDCATITPDVIETFVSNKQGSEDTKKNAQAHILALLRYIVKNNVNDAYGKVSKDMLVYLI